MAKRISQELYLEIVSWKTANHPRLLPLLGVTRLVVEQPVKVSMPMCMVSPLMTNGTLQHACGPETSPSTRDRYVRALSPLPTPSELYRIDQSLPLLDPRGCRRNDLPARRGPHTRGFTCRECR